MENFVASLELIFPIVFYMVIGFIVKRWLKLEEKTLWQMNNLVFSLFLPIFLFNSVYHSDFKQTFNPSVLFFAVVSATIMFIVLWFLIPKIEKQKTNQSVMIQGIYRSNYALFGMTMTRLMYGEHNLGMAGIVSAILMPMFSFFAVLLFESFRDDDIKSNKLTILVKILTNPLIVGSFLGLAFTLIGIKIPSFVESSLTTLGNIASPLALIVIGGIFSLDNVKKYAKQIRIVTVARLLIVPLIFVSLARAFGITGLNLYILLTLFASPTAISSFAMASSMGGNKNLAGPIVAITSVFSIFSIFLWTFFLKQLNWI